MVKNSFIYVHGWGSSGTGETATALKTLLPDLITPSFDYYHPAKALKELLELVDSLNDKSDVYLIASSLGGFFAEHVANTRVVNVVFFNPSLRPGTSSKIDPAVKLDYQYIPLPASPTKYSRRTVVVCTDDDIVDPSYARQYFKDYPVRLETGGHRITSAHLPVINEVLNTLINTI